MSMANTRLSRCAQVIARCRSVADALAHSVAAAARVLGTIRARSGLAGANTPWYLIRCAAEGPLSDQRVGDLRKHVFDGNLTIKSILTGALGDPDDQPEPDRDWPDGRRARGTRNERIECAVTAAR